MVRLKEVKDYQRTIRMTDRVRLILETYEGKGLNQKFENLVLDSNETLPHVLGEVDKLKRQKEILLEEIKELTDLKKTITSLRLTLNQAVSISKDIDKEASKRIKQIK